MSIPAIAAGGLSYEYDQENPALNGVTLEIAEGAFVAVVGQNGSGKTTLIKHLNGLLKPTQGCVRIFGVDTREVSIGQLARTVGLVFQNPDHQIFCASTREEIAFGPRNLGLEPAQVQERVDEALAAFNLDAYAALPPAVLGFGLRRKVTIAAVCAMRPRILVLDEPTAGLDWRSSQQLLQRLGALHQAGHTILLVTHDMRIAASYSEQTLVMHEGRVLAFGPTRSVFGNVEQLSQAQIMPPQVMQLGLRLAPLGMPPDSLTVAEFCAAYRGLRKGRP
jgi:energy-coupling factor transporter ATP-binding protein EcfA2